MKLRLSRRDCRRRIHAITSRLLDRYYWRETGYYYFGEFGYFHLEVLGGLETLFRRQPELRAKIATYPSYAQLLRSRFGDRVACSSPEWSFDERARICHDYHSRQFERRLSRLGFNHNLVSLFDGLQHRGQVHKARLFYLDSPLRAPNGDRTGSDRPSEYISIFPRGRQEYASKNLSADQWTTILRTVAERSSLPVVVHAVKSEMTPLAIAENFIHPRDVLEQVHYLNHSRYCLSPDSGFAQFALNCGCDVLVIGGTIQYHQFAAFNPFGNRLVITGADPAHYLPVLRKFIAPSVTPGERRLRH